jgi:arsenate reductase
MALTLWHNPRCSKSRQALKLLEEAGEMPKLRLYLKEPPSDAELGEVLAMLGMSAAQLIRTGERDYKALALADMAEPELIAAMVANPILIERPIAIRDGRAIIGRPPEAVLSLLA